MASCMRFTTGLCRRDLRLFCIISRVPSILPLDTGDSRRSPRRAWPALHAAVDVVPACSSRRPSALQISGRTFPQIGKSAENAKYYVRIRNLVRDRHPRPSLTTTTTTKDASVSEHGVGCERICRRAARGAAHAARGVAEALGTPSTRQGVSVFLPISAAALSSRSVLLTFRGSRSSCFRRPRRPSPAPSRTRTTPSSRRTTRRS